MKKGDVFYLKQKYGLYREVIISRVIDDAYVTVRKKDFPKEYQRIRIERLIKTPPKEWLEFKEKMERELRRDQAILDKLKGC